MSDWSDGTIKINKKLIPPWSSQMLKKSAGTERASGREVAPASEGFVSDNEFTDGDGEMTCQNKVKLSEPLPKYRFSKGGLACSSKNGLKVGKFRCPLSFT